MAVVSSAFGQVKLTDNDAKKFKNQVTYGKPKSAAHATVAQGRDLYTQFQSEGKVRIAFKAASKKK